MPPAEFPTNGQTYSTIQELKTLMAQGEPAQITQEGKFVNTEQEIAIAEMQEQLLEGITVIKETRWYTELSLLEQAIARIKIPDVYFEAINRFAEQNPLTHQRVKPTNPNTKIVYSKEAWDYMEKFTKQANSQGKENLIIVWGTMTKDLTTNQVIYHAKKPEYLSGARTVSGIDGVTLNNPDDMTLIGGPHTHLAEFSPSIQGAFSGLQDYSVAVDVSFSGQIGHSPLTHQFSGVVTAVGDETLVGHYIFEPGRGTTTIGGKQIPGEICKFPGIFVEDDNGNIWFLPAYPSVKTSIPIHQPVQVATKKPYGSYKIDHDWENPTQTQHPPTAPSPSNSPEPANTLHSYASPTPPSAQTPPSSKLPFPVEPMPTREELNKTKFGA